MVATRFAMGIHAHRSTGYYKKTPALTAWLEAYYNNTPALTAWLEAYVYIRIYTTMAFGRRAQVASRRQET